MRVRDIMATNVISVLADGDVEDAARLMAQHRISGLPVVDQNDKLVGLVTEYDLISKKGARIADVMTAGVISITPDADVEQVAEVLASRRIRRVPVMDGSRMIGIVSRSDLIKQIAMRWICHVCGEAVFSEQTPQHCSSCGAGEDAFSHEVMMPGM